MVVRGAFGSCDCSVYRDSRMTLLFPTEAEEAGGGIDLVGDAALVAALAC